METDPAVFREACSADVQAIFDVRTSVTENLIRMETLRKMGITPDSTAASFETNTKGWVAERRGEVAAFSLADRESGSIFALFVRPGHERLGLGSQLLTLAVQWLWDNGAESIWLTTAPNTRAAKFYANRGWTKVGVEPNGDVRLALRRPVAAVG